jgi:hypothetical protein
MDLSSLDLNSLIDQTEALSWDDPSSQLETQTNNPLQSNCLPLVGQLISQRTHNNQSVNAALKKAWEFAVPFSFTVLGPNKYLLKLSKEEHIEKIFKQVTWNVNGSLLVLRIWSPAATIGELVFNKSPFWIQVHGLPLINMTIKNAIAIAKGLGRFLKVEDFGASGATFKSYLRLLVEIDVSTPLKPGFLFNREGGDSIEVSLIYERLDEYCISCGLIGHKKYGCRSPPELQCPGKYKNSLKEYNFSNLPPVPFGGKKFPEGEPSQSSSSTSLLQGVEVTQTFVGSPEVSPLPKTSSTLEPLKNQTNHHIISPPLTPVSDTQPPNTFIPSLNANSHFPPTALLETPTNNFPSVTNQPSNQPNQFSQTNQYLNIFQILPGPISTGPLLFGNGLVNPLAQTQPFNLPSFYPSGPLPTRPPTETSSHLLTPSHEFHRPPARKIRKTTTSRIVPYTTRSPNIPPSLKPENEHPHTTTLSTRKRPCTSTTLPPTKKGPSAPSLDFNQDSCSHTQPMDTIQEEVSVQSRQKFPARSIFKAARKGKNIIPSVELSPSMECFSPNSISPDHLSAEEAGFAMPPPGP